MSNYKLGIIGGSGLYSLENYKNNRWKEVITPWGHPSDKVLTFFKNDKEVFFLPRHGKNHTISPSKINYRANIAALKQCGVTDIISFSAVGSLNKNISPGMFVVMQQYVDRTYKRENTFFDDDIVAYVPMSTPVSKSLSDTCENVLESLKIKHKKSAIYVGIEGPQFSTHAESLYYKNNKIDVIGMTNLPEAKLAREAEIRYASIGMVTDYDCFKDEYMDVDITRMVAMLKSNVMTAKNVIKHLINSFEDNIDPNDQDVKCLDSSIITNLDNASKSTIKKLKHIIKRFKNKNYRD